VAKHSQNRDKFNCMMEDFADRGSGTARSLGERAGGSTLHKSGSEFRSRL
jgi:hypothetical protein